MRGHNTTLTRVAANLIHSYHSLELELSFDTQFNTIGASIWVQGLLQMRALVRKFIMRKKVRIRIELEFTRSIAR